MKFGEGNTTTPAPEGTHAARCFAVIDLGTQTSEWQGETISKRKVLLGFELPDEMHTFDSKEGPRPFSVWSQYTASMHPKSQLRPTLEAWRGQKFAAGEAKDFEFKNLLGVPAMVTITHNERGYANIAAIAKMPKGMKCAAPVNPKRYLSLEKAEFDPKDYSALSEKLKEKIAKSPEYQHLFDKSEPSESEASHGEEAPPAEDTDSSVPF